VLIHDGRIVSNTEGNYKKKRFSDRFYLLRLNLESDSDVKEIIYYTRK